MGLLIFDDFGVATGGASITVTTDAFFDPLSDCSGFASVPQFFSIDGAAFTAGFVSFTTRGADGSDSSTILPGFGVWPGTPPPFFFGNNVDSVLLSLNVVNAGNGPTTAAAVFTLNF